MCVTELREAAREPHPPSFINIVSQAPTPGLSGQTESRNHSVLKIGLTAWIPGQGVHGAWELLCRQMLAGALRGSVRKRLGRQSLGATASCPARGLSFFGCPRSRSAESPGPWGPNPTPPSFRGTRPGAGAPLPHRLRLPLKPLRSGHRFLGSPSQGQAEWPTGGARARFWRRAAAPQVSRTG